MTLFRIALAWCLAMAIASQAGMQLWLVVAACGFGVAFGLHISRREPRLARIVFFLTIVALAAFARYDSVGTPTANAGIGRFNGGEPLALRGVILDEPETRERSQGFILTVDSVLEAERDEWLPTSGKVQITTRLFPEMHYGDSLEVTGALESPPVFDDFDYREYLARKGIVSLSVFPSITRTGVDGGSNPKRAVIDLRNELGSALSRTLPEPEAALARGILLGQRASIPEDLTEDFNASGLSHLIAISGYNVMLVAGLVVGSLAWATGKRKAIVMGMVVIALYSAFVGASPSVMRAFVMAMVLLGALFVGRPHAGLGAILLTGATMTLIDPRLADDVSFQLSFTATLGIILLGKRIQYLLQDLRFPSILAEPLAVTSAASIAVLPVITKTFGYVSVIALPANLVAVPAFPVILLTSALTAVAGVISTGLGRFIAEVAYLPLAYLVLVARAAANVPTIDTSGTITLLAIAAFIVSIAGVAHLLRRFTSPSSDRFRIPSMSYAATIVGVLAALSWSIALSPEPAGQLTVTMLDVGQGDSILIEAPSGARILVDGGPSGDLLMRALGEEMPPSARRIDLVVITHPQDDHLTGLVELIRRYDVRAVLTGPDSGTTAASIALREELASRSITLRQAIPGEWMDLGDNARIEVLGPAPITGTDTLNDRSVVMRVVYGSVSFLLTGDIEAPAENALLASGLPLQSTVLKVPHHGSDGSTTPAFLSAVDPEYAIISVGETNTFGHPSPTTLLRLAGIPILRTDTNGSIRFETNGTSLWLHHERGAPRITVPFTAQP